MTMKVNVVVNVEIDREQWARLTGTDRTDDEIRPSVRDYIQETVIHSIAGRDGRLLSARSHLIKGVQRRR